MSFEPICTSCENSIWCGTLAEWKCVKKEIRVSAGKALVECDDHKNRKKDSKKRPCMCEDCLKSGVNEVIAV